MIFVITEHVTGQMVYYYDIEADSIEEALEIYKNTYPSDNGSEFSPDDNGDNHTEISWCRNDI